MVVNFQDQAPSNERSLPLWLRSSDLGSPPMLHDSTAVSLFSDSSILQEIKMLEVAA